MGEIGSLSKGKGLLKEDIRSSGYVPAVPYTALYTDFSEVLDYGRIKWFVDDTEGTVVVDEPCVLIASSSNMAENTGKASAPPRHVPIAVGREVIIFRTGNSATFISYLLSTVSYRKRTLALARGTTIKHLYPATFADYKLCLPPLQEQHAIAEALSDVDGLIGGLDALIAKKRAIKQAAMQQLLTGKTRLPGFSEEWQAKRLGDMAIFLKGAGLPKTDLDDHGEWPCVHYGELFTRYGELIDRVQSRTHPISEMVLSQSNDVLMPTSDVTPNGLAKASCIDDPGVILGGDILVIRAQASQLNGTFLAYQIRIRRSQIMQLVTGSTVFHLYGRDMANFAFEAPSRDEQDAIVKVLTEMGDEVGVLEQRCQKVHEIKQGMMQQLLTGRIRLVPSSTAGPPTC